MHNLALGYLPWQHTVTHRVTSAQAPELYRGILNGNADGVTGRPDPLVGPLTLTPA